MGDWRLRRWRPIKQAQTQIDGAGIQGIDIARDVHIQSQRFVGIELVGTANQDRSEVSPDTPVASLVGISQRGTTHCLAQSHCIEFGGVVAQCGFDVAQRFAPSQLRVGHDAKVLSAGQYRDSRVTRVTRNDASEAGPGHKLHQLGEKRLAKIHEKSPKKSIWGNYSRKWLQNSNRHQIKRAARPRGYWLLAEIWMRSPDSSEIDRGIKAHPFGSAPPLRFRDRVTTGFGEGLQLWRVCHRRATAPPALGVDAYFVTDLPVFDGGHSALLIVGQCINAPNNDFGFNDWHGDAPVSFV